MNFLRFCFCTFGSVNGAAGDIGIQTKWGDGKEEREGKKEEESILSLWAEGTRATKEQLPCWIGEFLKNRLRFFFKRFLSSEKDWTSWRIVEMRNSKCAKDHTQNMHYKNRVLHIYL